MTTTLPAAPAAGVDANDLRVTRVRPLRGPNYWRLAPVIACDVRLGSLETKSTAELAGFSDRLLDALPTLREHPCSQAFSLINTSSSGLSLPLRSSAETTYEVMTLVMLAGSTRAS